MALAISERKTRAIVLRVLPYPEISPSALEVVFCTISEKHLGTNLDWLVKLARQKQDMASGPKLKVSDVLTVNIPKEQYNQIKMAVHHGVVIGACTFSPGLAASGKTDPI